jgi:recombination protein RecA
LDLGVDVGVVEKSGAWYSFEEERIGQGRENARRFLRENLDARDRLSEKVYTAKGIKRAVPARAPEPAVAEPEAD